MARKNDLLAIGITAVFMPLLILTHELAHYSTALSLGAHPKLCYDQMLLSSADMQILGQKLAWVILAGPIIELTLASLSMGWLLWRNRMRSDLIRPVDWIFTAFGMASLRWLKVIVDGSMSDEAKLSEILGFHHLALPIFMLIYPLLSVFAMTRFHARHRTLKSLGWAGCASVFAGLAWIYWIGPILLPYPQHDSH